MYIVYMAGRPPRQKAKNEARQQLCFSCATRICAVLCAAPVRRCGMAVMQTLFTV